jgi:hypothetical protein
LPDRLNVAMVLGKKFVSALYKHIANGLMQVIKTGYNGRVTSQVSGLNQRIAGRNSVRELCIVITGVDQADQDENRIIEDPSFVRTGCCLPCLDCVSRAA